MPVPYCIYSKISPQSDVWQVRKDVHEILRKLFDYKNIEIVTGAVCSDHVHLCVNIPPKMSVSQFVGYLKGKSALMFFDRYPNMGSKYSRAFWTRGYFVTIVGEVNEEAARKYIQEQQEEDKKTSN